MLLIRGMGNEEHARQINEGIVGCRDLFSSLVAGIKSNYRFSAYYEKLFHQNRKSWMAPLRGVEKLDECSVLLIRTILDSFIAESYMTYFHVVDNEESLRWVEDWSNDAHFIYYEPHFEFEECVCGLGYCGQRMKYVNDESEINVREAIASNVGLIPLLDRETFECNDLDLKAHYAASFIDSVVPLFHRIVDETFTERENEYRLFARSERNLLNNGVVNIQIEHPRICEYAGKEYEIVVEDVPDYATGIVELRIFMKDGEGAVFDLVSLLSKGETVNVRSSFLSLDIRDTAESYGYIGQKKDCLDFLTRELRGDRFKTSDSNNHFFDGNWDDLRKIRIRSVEEREKGGIVLKPPEDNHYKLFSDANE